MATFPSEYEFMNKTTVGAGCTTVGAGCTTVGAGCKSMFKGAGSKKLRALNIN